MSNTAKEIVPVTGCNLLKKLLINVIACHSMTEIARWAKAVRNAEVRG